MKKAEKNCLEPVSRKEEMSPFVIEFQMVEGFGFRCMAYRNEDGKWHEAFDNRELSGEIRIVE